MASETSASSALDGRVAEEPEAATRERLGPMADPLLLDQQVDCSRARALGWRPSGPAMLDDLATGSYATAGARS